MATRTSGPPLALPLEAALAKLQSAMKIAGFESGAPENLVYLLKTYGQGRGDEGKKALYKRLYTILWYGSKQTLGKKEGHVHPTYIFPEEIKAVVRARFPDSIKEYTDPTGDQVYKVTVKDLAQGKWPNPPRRRPKKQ